MLSHEALNRRTPAYRHGYKSGYYGEQNRAEAITESGSVAYFDYNQGYNNGNDDSKWDKTRSVNK
jgi:hypothetical protein